jgi:hypothetical protein
VHNLKP